MKDKRAFINIDLEEEFRYHARMICISFEVRIMGIFLALFVAYIVKYVFKMPVLPQVFGLFFLWLATCAAYLIAIKRTSGFSTRNVIDNMHFSYYFLGIFYVTGLVHYLGGIEWVGFILYVFDIVYGNVLLSRARGAFVTGLIMVNFVALGFLEYKGIMPHREFLLPEFTSYRNFQFFVTMCILVGGGVFFVLSFLTGLFTKISEDREKSILDSKKRFEVKSKELEKIAGALRKKVAENKYIKRTAMGYVEKKEAELLSVKEDLEKQIDKLKKTQRSMFFMIEDLNDMSTQLKEARDNLEEKVKERTDELLSISKKLHRSERLAFLGKLAGSVTHELRNPLAVLKNAAYYLEKKSDDADKKILKYIDVIKKEIAAIDSVIDDVMGFAKTKPPKFEFINVKDIINDVLSMINVPRFIEIRKEFQDTPEIEVDRSQVTHAVVNIVNNAIIAMKGNGILIFRTFMDRDYVTIEIRDNGPGIPVEERNFIFEPLYSSRPKGTGLGLPIAKMMIENQKGIIEFISELGKGTTFRISLPSKTGKRGESE